MMRCSSLLAGCAAGVGLVNGLNVLITNDDGFGTSHIRELYKQMTSLGHNCYIVASATDQSAMGARVEFTNSPKLLRDAEWSIVKAGAPSLGIDPVDNHIWYYNGTPTAQVLVALDHILPTVANFQVPDLVLSGPNFGLTIGPSSTNIPGTIGAAYAAIERGIPAVAFSSGNDAPTPYYWVNASTPAGLQDPSTITGRLAAAFVQSMVAKASTSGSPLLPKGYGISVNLPFITSYTSNQCINPPFVYATVSQNGTSAKISYDSQSGLVQLDNAQDPRGSCGDNACICLSGGRPRCLDDSLHSLNAGCISSVTVFTLESPTDGKCVNVTDLTALVPLIVSTGTEPPAPGLGANASVTSNHSHSDPPTGATTPATTPHPVLGNMGMGIKMEMQVSMTVLILWLGVAALFM